MMTNTLSRNALARNPHNPKNPHRIVRYSVADGRDAVGFIEVRDNYFITFDVNGQLVGKFQNLQVACRALPEKSA